MGEMLPLPEIYYAVNAGQWTVVRKSTSDYFFAGVTGESGASLSPQQGWNDLAADNSGLVSSSPGIICFGCSSGSSSVETANTPTGITITRSGNTITETDGAPPYAKTAQHTLTPGPAGIKATDAAAPAQTIAAGLLPGDTPVPVSPSVISVQNAWEVSTGSELVAVYAGSSGADPTDGRFVIVRQQQPGGTETISTVDVPGAGGLSISKAPSSSLSPTTASLPFRTASGTAGVLHLTSDTTGGE